MKLSRTKLFIVISSLALAIVLIIQVNWIFRTAQIKEKLFNEKAEMVLARTTEALYADEAACTKIAACIGANDQVAAASQLEKNEKQKLDSLFTHYMKFYDFHVDYTYEVLKPGLPDIASNTNRFAASTSFYTDQAGCYEKPLEAFTGKNGLQLKLILPDKKQFIFAEMGTQFITSVVLIIVVLVMFWRTTLSLVKEKKISEHTTDFLNNMTHEFKTPLTNIALAGRMIAKDSSIHQEEKIKHYSGIILEENEKLRLQVEQVLSMTALERGEIPVQKTELDFHALITTCLKPISMQIENKQGNLKLQLDAERFVVAGDKAHLSNAFCNLVDNAIKYSTEKPELAIRTYNTNQRLAVEISDKGIGIEKEYHQKVFDKFFRVPTGDVHDVKGFGLGLAYIKKIVELHGGSIALESEKGKGSTFTLILPYV